MDAGKVAVSRSTRSAMGNAANPRAFLWLLVSLLAWTLEVGLFLLLWSIHVRGEVPFYLYSIPLAHLLPWVAAWQYLRRIGCDTREKGLSSAEAQFRFSMLLGLVSAAYVALGCCEIGLGLYLRLLH